MRLELAQIFIFLQDLEDDKKQAWRSTNWATWEVLMKEQEFYELYQFIKEIHVAEKNDKS